MKKQLITAATAAGILFTTFGGSASAHENIYTIKSGDTLWKVSQANHISVTDLKTWNKLSNDTIYVNQKLSLLAPHTHETQLTSENNRYIVKSGDTLWGIAKANNTTVANLKTLNGLTTDNIYINQQLQLPGGTVSAPVVSTPVASTVSTAQLIIDEAKKYIGTPYLWGGTTPAGFDCSGFTQYIFKKAGITIPRTTSTQWTGLKAVSNPNPGDLVFFETYTTGPSHVGIYLGNNKFINAASDGVTISDMTVSYWKSRYLGARTAF